ncbi:(3S,6E)-nerolidol synthase 1 [Vitis vinifera]|uniref:(3S,6E)-nerolidol synthase 1 n=1 Tax=Vitis vinifera TaxID=29760 RepID=A0A438HPQ0_VITVI|nr:(3S,6E)-nerolidol synthase 1 [Vitis vinifera]
MPSAHTWSIAKDQNLVSIPSEKDNHPSTEYPSPTNEFYMEHAQKLEEVRRVLKEVGEDTLEALLMIDAIQRLGMTTIFMERLKCTWLPAIETRRLLYVFNNLKDTEGKLQEKLSEDIKGLMVVGQGVEVCKKPTTEMVHVALGGPPDPSLSEQRVELTKPISLVYIIDDIFDVHGTLDELTLFTEAVTDYMKICFNALNGITNEISSKVYNDHGLEPHGISSKGMGMLCNAFLVEAKWFADGHVPKADEYLKNGVISSGVHVVLVHMFFLLGHGITKRNVDIVG